MVRLRIAAMLALVSLAWLGGCAEERILPHGVVVSASPRELDFGTVPVGSSRRLALILENTSRRTVTLQPNRIPLDVSVEPRVARVPASGRVRVEVTFRPRSERALEDLLRFEEGELGVEVGLRGVAVARLIEVEESVDFGGVRVGDEKTHHLVIRNRTEERLHVIVGVGASGAFENFRFEPAEIGLEPGGSTQYAITYRPRGEGRHDASLDVIAAGAERRTLHLLGHGRRALVSVSPAPILFDQVLPGEMNEIQVVVTNVGEVPTGPMRIVVDDVRFPRDRGELASLEPGETDGFAIRHLASQSDPVIETELRLVAEDDSVLVTVPVVARIKGAHLLPSEPVFAIAPVGWTGEMPYLSRLELRDVGLEPGAEIAAWMEGPDAANFRIWAEGDGRSQGKVPTAFLVAFNPIRFGDHQASIVLRVDLEEVEVPIHGWGNLPVAECSTIANRIPVLTNLQLNGRDGSRLGDAACEWSLVKAPGYLTDTPLPQGCTVSYRPLLVGDYVFELKVTDVVGNYDRCQVSFEATPEPDLWVETFWDQPSDVDLYLLNLAMADPEMPEDWWSIFAACYYYNCQEKSGPLPWGPDPTNSPVLNHDDTRNRGPENIQIEDVPLGLEYAFGVHWFNSRAKPSNRATVSVYCYGEKMAELQVDFREQWEFHRLGTISFPGSRRCQVDIAPVVWERFYPGGLPPEEPEESSESQLSARRPGRVRGPRPFPGSTGPRPPSR